jgi:hypothetical protein
LPFPSGEAVEFEGPRMGLKPFSLANSKFEVASYALSARRGFPFPAHSSSSLNWVASCTLSLVTLAEKTASTR